MSEFGSEEPDEREYEEARANQAASQATTVMIGGIPVSALEHVMTGALESIIVARGWKEQAQKEIQRRAQEAVNTITPEVVRDLVGAEVARVIAEGIPEHEVYSGKELKRRTIAELVVTSLNSPSGDRSSNKTLLQSMIHTAVQEVFSREMTKVVDEARTSVKAQVDAVLAGKLTEALKQALAR